MPKKTPTNEQAKRNRWRFPDDFMFQLTAEEADSLRSQIATLKTGRAQHRKGRPYAFTDHGAVMLASVLNRPTAVAASVQVRSGVSWSAGGATGGSGAPALSQARRKRSQTPRRRALRSGRRPRRSPWGIASRGAGLSRVSELGRAWQSMERRPWRRATRRLFHVRGVKSGAVFES
ncbi:MAG: ORF6N domain-containing protein [Acidobacteria bacterium]|nr:ORF6N domain-containing protein [Acidobacteriota bacterium]